MTEFFEHFNPNPLFKPMKNGKIKHWNRDDDAVRSICAATNLSWTDANRELFEKSQTTYDIPTGDTNFDETVTKLGFERKSFGRPGSGVTRPKVSEFINEHPSGIYILNLSNYHVCVKNGKIYDVVDQSNSKIYSYFEKVNE